MKHLTTVTTPSKACLTEDHPSLMDSITGFLADPAGTIQLHLDKLKGEM